MIKNFIKKVVDESYMSHRSDKTTVEEKENPGITAEAFLLALI